MIINLISGPRNISTALMTSFAQRSDTKVLDEPFYAYYLKISGVDHPGREETLNQLDQDLPSVYKRIDRVSRQSEHVFIKNMAHHLIKMDLQDILDYANVMLIREPKELIASFSKVIENPTMADIGLKRAVELFDYIFQQTAKKPPVLNSNEVLKDPEKVLSALCEKLGIAFEKSMLSWPKGAVYDEVPWAKYWYKNVLDSTGFGKPVPKEINLTPQQDALYRESLPYFEILNKNAIKA